MQLCNLDYVPFYSYNRMAKQFKGPTSCPVSRHLGQISGGVQSVANSRTRKSACRQRPALRKFRTRHCIENDVRLRINPNR
jgi:hypothetical protein